VVQLQEVMKYLIKIDISGIQSFIFDIPSKGAAKQLKARSVYVQAITEIAQKFFEEKYGSLDVVYNGGGNLFFYIDTSEENLKKAIEEFQKHFQQENIFPIIAYVTSDNFQADMKAVALKANQAKLQKPLYTQTYTYTPIKEDKWKEFTEELVRSKGFEIIKKAQENANNPFCKAGFTFQLSQKNTQFHEKITNKLPQTEKSITEFETIVTKAQGDPKLAALKIDVDNLGQLFRNKTREEYKKNSEYLSKFFEIEIYQILKPYIDETSLYPIFAGGDDCFLVGAWDKVLEVASIIQEKFDIYQREKQLQLTISAGVVIVPYSFPMIRLAEEAERALELSKKHEKNKISIFGEPISWKEFKQAKEIAEKLRKFVQEQGVSRAVLQRLKSEDIGYTRQQEFSQTKKLNFPKVHRLKYYLRNFQKDEIKEPMKILFKEYEQALLYRYIGKKGLNPMVFPIAARWAELLTKSQKDNS